MRTWDTPGRVGQVPILEAIPTNTAVAANAALRGDFKELSSSYPTVPGLGELALLGESLPSVEDTLALGVGELLEASPVGRVAERDVRQALQARVSIFNGLVANDASVPLFEFTSESTESARERFREALAGVMLRPDSRKNLLARAADYVNERSQLIRGALATGTLQYDHVIRGGGLHAANLVATIQEADPDATMLIIDDGEDGMELGGQFRKYGDTPVFYMNSRVRPVYDYCDVYGIPK